MSAFTKERLIEKLQHRISVASGFPESEKAQMDLELARIALASLEAEPVEWRVVFKLDGQPGSDFEKTFENQAKMNEIISLHERAGFCASITALYTAPLAPLSVPDDVMAAMQKVARIRLDLNDFDGDKRGILDCLSDAEEALIEVVNRRAAMLQGAEPVTTGYKLPFDKWLSQQYEPVDVDCGCVTTEAFNHWLRVAYEAGNSPVTPDGWVACSERMPEAGVKVLCFPVNDEPIHATYNGQVWLQDISWSTSDEPIDNVISCNVFHWMPLPAAPQQEVK